MLGYLTADVIFTGKQVVFRERSLRETIRFKEQIMSKDIYPNIFSRQLEAFVFTIS